MSSPAPTPAPRPEAALDLGPYDGILLLSFGGPESPEEVLPFLRRVTAGRGIPDERLAEVGEHYHRFGGRSPINDQNRALLIALRAELDRRGCDLPLLWGNRNAAPFTADALRDATDRGLRHLVTVVTSAYSSYSSCRQYREDLAAAAGELADELEGTGATVPAIDKVRPYAQHPAFGAVNTRLVTDAVRPLRSTADTTRLLFVTHSIPSAMDDTSGPGDGEGSLYQHQHLAVAHAVTAEVNATLDLDLEADLVYCSRSGPPSQPWLEPDVNDRIEELTGEGATAFVVVPIGFVSDHMEVIYDLDTEAAETAERLGVQMVRVPTVGTDGEFVSGLVDLLGERAAQARGEAVTVPAWPAQPPPRPSVCAPGCCPNLRDARPALCGSD